MLNAFSRLTVKCFKMRYPEQGHILLNNFDFLIIITYYSLCCCCCCCSTYRTHTGILKNFIVHFSKVLGKDSGGLLSP